MEDFSTTISLRSTSARNDEKYLLVEFFRISSQIAEFRHKIVSKGRKMHVSTLSIYRTDAIRPYRLKL